MYISLIYALIKNTGIKYNLSHFLNRDYTKLDKGINHVKHVFYIPIFSEKVSSAAYPGNA